MLREITVNAEREKRRNNEICCVENVETLANHNDKFNSTLYFIVEWRCAHYLLRYENSLIDKYK